MVACLHGGRLVALHTEMNESRKRIDNNTIGMIALIMTAGSPIE